MDPPGEDGRNHFVFYLSAEYASGPATVASLVIVKRPLPLDSTVPLQQQLQILNFPLGAASRSAQDAVSPYESLHSMVRYGIAPCFEANTRGEAEQPVRRGKSSDDAKTGIFNTCAFFQSATNRKAFLWQRRKLLNWIWHFFICCKMLRFQKSLFRFPILSRMQSLRCQYRATRPR